MLVYNNKQPYTLVDVEVGILIYFFFKKTNSDESWELGMDMKTARDGCSCSKFST